jgi:hypothetical protein
MHTRTPARTHCDIVTDNCEDTATLRNIYNTFEIQKPQTKLKPNEV